MQHDDTREKPAADRFARQPDRDDPVTAESDETRPEEKKKFVRDKFAAISARYDFLNSLLSMQIDRYWRWRTIRELREFPAGYVLDLCAGTMPLSKELTRREPQRLVMALDFCEDMLRQGIRTIGRDSRRSRIFPVCGDGEDIPVPDNSVWGCTVAFGVRNIARTRKSLQEMYRVLQPSGKLLILEFSRPENPIFKPFYSLYLNHILPRIAGVVSGDKEAYEYLASSIAEFYEPGELMDMLRETGFSQSRYRQMTFGVVTLYIAVK